MKFFHHVSIAFEVHSCLIILMTDEPILSTKDAPHPPTGALTKRTITNLKKKPPVNKEYIFM